jgi:hypothetical protein
MRPGFFIPGPRPAGGAASFRHVRLGLHHFLPAGLALDLLEGEAGLTEPLGGKGC